MAPLGLGAIFEELAGVSSHQRQPTQRPTPKPGHWVRPAARKARASRKVVAASSNGKPRGSAAMVGKEHLDDKHKHQSSHSHAPTQVHSPVEYDTESEDESIDGDDEPEVDEAENHQLRNDNAGLRARLAEVERSNRALIDDQNGLRNEVFGLHQRLAVVEDSNQVQLERIDALEAREAHPKRENKRWSNAFIATENDKNGEINARDETIRRLNAEKAQGQKSDPLKLQAQIAEKDKDIEKLEEARRVDEERLQTAARGLQNLATQLAEKDKQIKQLNKARQSDYQQLWEHVEDRREQEVLEKALEDVRAQNTASQRKVQQLEQENKTLQSEVDTAQDSQLRLVSDVTQLIRLVRDADSSVPRPIADAARQMSTKIARPYGPRK
ncbi:hypothetical protein IWX50DRAFT_618069 [Phyllosticta citricarpa]